MSCGIYCIENKINHKKYVGQSIDIKSRWTQHRHTSSLVRDTFLYRAMDKYGVENFDFYILEECQPDELDIKEIYWIATLDTYNYGYNMTLGGSGLVGYKAYNRNCIPKNFGMLSNGVDETVPIIKLDTNYEVLEYYVSVQDCARANGIASTNISKTASGKNNTCHGYIFMYFNDIKDMTTDEIISYRLHQRKNYKDSTLKSIDRISSSGEIINNYESISQAAKELNLDPSSISKVCKGKLKQTHGYKVRYAVVNNKE